MLTETINKCLLHVHTCNKHMAHSASDAANAGAMVVHTTEDTPVGDGDPICELAHVEGAIEAVTAGAKVIGRVMVLALQVENAFRNRISVTDKVADLRARLLRHYGEDTKSTGYRRAMTELAHAATLAVVHLCGAEEEGGSSLAVLGQGRLTQHTAGTLASSAVATFGQIMARGPASRQRKNEPLAVLAEYMRDRVRFTHPRFTSSLLPFTTPQDTRLSTDLVYQLMLRMDPKSAGFQDGAVGKDAKADAERSVRETVAPQHNRDVRREQDAKHPVRRVSTTHLQPLQDLGGGQVAQCGLRLGRHLEDAVENVTWAVLTVKCYGQARQIPQSPGFFSPS